MSDGTSTVGMLGDLPPFQALLLAYAVPAEQPWHRLCWLLDQRLAQVVRRGGEPTIAAIRLAWWDAVLVEGDLAKGGGEPLVEAWRKAAPSAAAPLVEQLIDGWRGLLGAESLSMEELTAFGRKRGGALFGLLSRTPEEAVACGGAVWALWDLAGHSGDPELAMAAMSVARDMCGDGAFPRDRRLKPLRLSYAIARVDVMAGRIPIGGFEACRYRRLLWRSLVG